MSDYPFYSLPRLCLSITDFHPDTWNPAWSVSTILTGLLSFMVEKGPTLGSIETSDYTVSAGEWNDEWKTWNRGNKSMVFIEFYFSQVNIFTKVWSAVFKTTFNLLWIVNDSSALNTVWDMNDSYRFA